MEHKPMTMQKAALTALEIQNGCNLSGIANALNQALQEALWPEARRIGEGMQWVNRHPIVSLFLDKLCDLNAYGYTQDAFAKAYDAVEQLAIADDADCSPSGPIG